MTKGLKAVQYVAYAESVWTTIIKHVLAKNKSLTLSSPPTDGNSDDKGSKSSNIKGAFSPSS